METVSETKMQICPHCRHHVKVTNGSCEHCGKSIFPGYHLPTYSELVLKPKNRYTKFAIYSTAGLNFALGIMEGFLDNNSAAMTLNLSISLILLSVSPRASHSPLLVLVFVVGINVLNQMVSPLYNIFILEKWLWVKGILIIIPTSAIVILLSTRRVSS
jgi:hypothetical protein